MEPTVEELEQELMQRRDSFANLAEGRADKDDNSHHLFTGYSAGLSLALRELGRLPRS